MSSPHSEHLESRLRTMKTMISFFSLLFSAFSFAGIDESLRRRGDVRRLASFYGVMVRTPPPAGIRHDAIVPYATARGSAGRALVRTAGRIEARSGGRGR